MQKEDIPDDLTILAFDFFFFFSRFEFALKENEYLKNHTVGAKAEPGWSDFVTRWEGEYNASNEALKLIEASPKSQIVGTHNQLTWKTVSLIDCKTQLAIVIRLLKTIRNNLFHGGKHGGDNWDDVQRTRELLSTGKIVLDQLAKLASIEADYFRYY